MTIELKFEANDLRVEYASCGSHRLAVAAQIDVSDEEDLQRFADSLLALPIGVLIDLLARLKESTP